MDFFDLAKERYSCRSFSDKEVEQEKLDKIIEAANLAPTAVNKQPFKIFVFKSEESIKVLEQATRFTFGAKTFLMVGAKEDIGWTRKYDGRGFADVDASIVATFIMMQIKDLGLDTTWVGHFNAPLIKELIPSTKDYDLIAVFPIGYAALDAEPNPRHFERKSIEEIVENI